MTIAGADTQSIWLNKPQTHLRGDYVGAFSHTFPESRTVIVVSHKFSILSYSASKHTLILSVRFMWQWHNTFLNITDDFCANPRGVESFKKGNFMMHPTIVKSSQYKVGVDDATFTHSMSKMVPRMRRQDVKQIKTSQSDPPAMSVFLCFSRSDFSMAFSLSHRRKRV